MFSADNITVRFGGFTLLDGVNFIIDKKDKIALVGKNGAGKSTLLKIFAGLQTPSTGNVTIPQDAVTGYLPQHMNTEDKRTVREEAALAFIRIIEIEKEIDRLGNTLANYTDYESDSCIRLINKMTILNERLEILGSGNREAEIEKTLTGLGFSRTDMERFTGEFSGGWRMRIELAKILLQKPDMLLLDEPTNHLDIEAIEWLESFLVRYAGALILVSHDRAFIDAACGRTIELSLGKAYDYRVNYTKYIDLRQERREQQIRAYENQRKQIEDTEEFIERFRSKASKAIQVQSRIKQLNKIDRIQIDQEDVAALRLKFQPATRSGAYPIIIENLRKTYGQQVILNKVNLAIARGEKIAFAGKNGEGKSTLIKCIMGEIPFEGSLKTGHNVSIGYFAQNQADLMDVNLTVFQTIDNVATGEIRTKIRDILGAFMFGGEASDKKVSVLSGGERTRLAMIKLLLEPVNLLILDEPTNHLDMRSKTVLKEAIRNFDGTAIIVSHDREFLDGLVTKVYEFANHSVREHIGGIYDFLATRKKEAKADTPPAKPAQHPPRKATQLPGDYWEEQKDRKRKRRKLEQEIHSLEAEISALEKESAEAEASITDAGSDASADLLWHHAGLQERISTLMERWSKASASLDNP
ncbi:MAG: ABC-F family ATP-binding cassette domain-containing protein [Dysgonamonadaceae bacterium]|jgi:ATP-binding cassette subfamily F protein 3|nr:ABC-F family ATP-binding cassette domain-containing protein [Dysgonamonadaceae bacterium]